jgi:hypothetical protein
MALTRVTRYDLHLMVGELTPALSAQRESRQTNEELGRNSKE